MSHIKTTSEQLQRNGLSSTTTPKSAYSAPKLTMFGSVKELTLSGVRGSSEGMTMVDAAHFA